MSSHDQDQSVDYGNPKTLDIDGSLVYSFDEETGILSLSANEKSCRFVEYAAGMDGSGKPMDVILVTDELPGFPPFVLLYDVREITSLPQKDDGTYWLAFGSGHDGD